MVLSHRPLGWIDLHKAVQLDRRLEKGIRTMTNTEKYTYWRTNYERMEKRYLEGNISADELDRLDGNMLERLGMNKWTQEEWEWEQAGWEGGL